MKEDEEEEEGQPLPSPGRADPTAEMTCGVCLSDVGRSIRGLIDSCDHHFCFVCIMEWAKVETRCPMCKQRFRSIRRPAVRGIFALERVVDVPERNQVYNPLGNESATLSDPYANIICSECKTTRDEELLLLCDLCDSASHTYCVGLGATVPEGDWYCRDCTKVRDEHSRTQSNSDGCNQDSCNGMNVFHGPRVAVRAPQTDVSVSGIVSDGAVPYLPQSFSGEQVSEGQNGQELRRNNMQRDAQVRTSVSISEIVSEGIVSILSEGFTREQVLEQQNLQELRGTTLGDSQGHGLPIRGNVASTEARGEQHVRTLRQCRNLQGRIRQIRENWNALRSGSLTFSSDSIDRTSGDNNKKAKKRVESAIRGKLESTSPAGRKQSTDVSAPSNTTGNAEPQDVNKAWKMMEIAKSMEGNVKRAVPNLSTKGNGPKVIRTDNPSSFVSKGHNSQYGLTGCSNFKLEDKQRTCLVFEKSYRGKGMEVGEHFHGGPMKAPLSYNMTLSSQKLAGVLPQGSVFCQKRPPPQQVTEGELTVGKKYDTLNCQASASQLLPMKAPRSHNMASSSQTLAGVSPQVSVCCQKKPPPQQVTEGELTVRKKYDALNCQAYASHLLPVQSSVPAVKPIDGERHDAESSADKTHAPRNENLNCSAKDEVQSLVKLNLKLQSKDRRLEADKFKEVARVATHTILAACGLEHSKSSARTISRPKCKHFEQSRELRKSNLMPGSCRECFFAFVKDVVNSIFSEKISLQ